ncbi:MAG: excinuclease ABC subunit A, partial [Jatrophihabitantaceae bacterium]
EAVPYFSAATRIHDRLRILQQVGLGYVKLGQQATTLSGGEAQRVKLASELQKRSTGRTIYVLDEPTTGLHFEDVSKLLGVLQSLVDKGNSVLVIEHNLDVIKTADWVIDMGPEGGSGGGTVVAEGTPEQVAGVSGSHTGHFLAGLLGDRVEAPTAVSSTRRSTTGAGVATKASPASNTPAKAKAATAKAALAKAAPAKAAPAKAAPAKAEPAKAAAAKVTAAKAAKAKPADAPAKAAKSARAAAATASTKRAVTSRSVPAKRPARSRSAG